MKICFWGDIARPLTGNTKGGGELQIALLAKALAKAGHEVIIVDFMAKETSYIQNGIKVINIKGWNEGIRIFRTFTHRLPNLYKTLKDQQADVYYCRIRDFRHILAYRAAHKLKAKFILGLASNLDAMNFSQRLKYHYLVSPGSLWLFSSGFLIELIQPFLLRKADLVIAQHELQKSFLKKKHIRSTILPNLIDCIEISEVSFQRTEDFIYVGSLDERKGFAEFFKLVQKTPSQSYKIIGQPRDKTASFYYNKLKEFDNVCLLGRLTHGETINHIASSKALISTSPMEGFPNVFVEAWACGIPVLSLYFDPGVIEKQQLGKVFNGNLDDLAEEIQKFSVSSEFSERAKSYVEKKHLLSTNKIKEINTLFNDLVRQEKK
jgi:glycosyltransferase involved in cell wall biosynthesis